ncbi:hypothetical protein ACHQM5_005876 [Ranunculus cassubicifolius]
MAKVCSIVYFLVVLFLVASVQKVAIAGDDDACVPTNIHQSCTDSIDCGKKCVDYMTRNMPGPARPLKANCTPSNSCICSFC